LLNIETIQKIDSKKIHLIYEKWPEIAKESYETDLGSVDFPEISHIVFAGMGGSGAISDIFSSILSKTNTHVCVVKGYLLPRTVDSKTLVVTTSISGNTEETLAVLDSAKNSNCKIIAFSSGGKMQDFCSKNKIEYRNIPMFHSPRASLTSFLYSMLKILQPVLPIKKEEVNESIINLKKLKQEFSSERLDNTNPALAIADWIDCIPIIYYPWGLQAAAIRFKNSLQENAKSHAIIEDVIEACHNGIVSWEKSSHTKPILLEGKDDFIKTKERWKILKEYFELNNIDFKEIHTISGNILSKLIHLIYLLDYSTIYLAIKNEIDPTPIKSIDFIKSKL